MKWSKPFLFFLGGGLFLFLPYLIQGQDTSVSLADQLDSNHVWYVLLKENQAFLSPPFSEIDGFLGTQFRLSYPSGFSVIAFLYFFLTPFLAFLVNKMLIYIIGFWGTWLLLSDQFRFTSSLAAWCALLWATSSFYPFMGVGIAALPAIFFCLHRIRNENFNLGDWFVIASYPFYAELVLVTFFLWLIAAGVGIIDLIFARKVKQSFLMSLLLMLLLMLAKDYQLILAIFTPSDFTSHRSEFFFDGLIVQKIIDPIKLLNGGAYTGMLYSPAIIWATILFLLLNFFRGNRLFYPFVSFLLACIVSALSSLLSFPLVFHTIGTLIQGLHSFNFSRIFNFVGFFLFLSFFLSIRDFSSVFRNTVMFLLLLSQLILVNYEWRSMLKKLIPTQKEWSYNPSYREFYSVDAFDRIKNHLPVDYNGYIGHINLPPAISAFNGLKVLDGYLPNYRLESKHQLKNVIAAELEKDHHIRNLFNYWGNKAYFFNASHQEWVYPIRQMFDIKITQLDFHWRFLKAKLNTHYIISAGEVLVPELELIVNSNDSTSCWDLYLYRIKE